MDHTKDMAGTRALRLGLIGGNIAASHAPRLQRLAGAQTGLDVQYDRIVPAELGEDFHTSFARCRTDGYRGVNITYPYKELAAAAVAIDNPLVQAIGAVNTVLFESDGPKGYNTDYTGFVSAYRAARGRKAPGCVGLIGSGGVGRALAFALASLQAREIRLFDVSVDKCLALSKDLSTASPQTRIVVANDAETACVGANGILNATPIGMDGHPGSPLTEAAIKGADWVFDAVYTPMETQFLKAAARAAVDTISGYELFFFQGVHAWTKFADRPLDEARLRRDLSQL